MKKILIVLAVVLFAAPAFADIIIQPTVEHRNGWKITKCGLGCYEYPDYKPCQVGICKMEKENI